MGLVCCKAKKKEVLVDEVKQIVVNNIAEVNFNYSRFKIIQNEEFKTDYKMG